MDINNFGPFDPEVWGTFSDWMIVLVTSVTGFLIWLTFRSQTKVQGMQQSITDIENERYRLEYKPVLEIQPVKVKNTIAGDRMQTYVKCSLKLLEKDAKDLDFKIEDGTGTIEKISISKNSSGKLLPLPNMYAMEEFDLHIQLSSMARMFPIEGCYFFFTINFSDTIGNKYKQRYCGIVEDVSIRLTHEHPERIIIK